MPAPDRLILMGVFGAPQGVRGEMRIKSLTRDPKAIGAYGPLTDRKRARVFVFDSLRLIRDNMLVARVADVTTREAAAALTGAEIFARNCSPCHGPRMQDPESAFDLRKFPPGEHDRFVRSVTNGKNQMPPWGDLLKSDDIEALWAYVIMGEKIKRPLPAP